MPQIRAQLNSHQRKLTPKVYCGHQLDSLLKKHILPQEMVLGKVMTSRLPNEHGVFLDTNNL